MIRFIVLHARHENGHISEFYRTTTSIEELYEWLTSGGRSSDGTWEYCKLIGAEII
jgi:hypothetical protein